MTKPIWKSKTFWFNAAAVAFMLVQLAADREVIVDAGGEAALLAFANIGLRFLSKVGVTIKRE